jgi:hypothetical protein
MADPDVVVVVPASDGGNMQPPTTPPPQPPSPPPPGGFWSTLYRDLTLQRVALIVFAGLAIAIILVTLLTLALPQDSARSLQISRTLTVLLITALTCASIAWLDSANLLMLGRGLRQVLSIQRAAVGTFVGASVATIAVAIFVALSALFAGGLEKGLYALASIEFLLKLAAVSAIVVLMTLRKPLVARIASSQKQPTGEKPAGQDEAEPVNVDQEDNGRLEFGGLSFAFSLVVIAALIVPSEDLMRMASMFFGGQHTLEQQLPTRPVITVEDDLSSQITRAVIHSIASRQIFAQTPLPELERQIDTLALQNQIFEVIADNLINNVERRGALTLLRAVCEDDEDTLIFANSDDRVLAEHIAFLTAEGLIEQPYGDLNLIQITSYGNNVVKGTRGNNCVDFSSPSPLVAVSTTDPTISIIPYENALTLPVLGMTFNLDLPAGRYRAELVAIDRVDPYLELLAGNDSVIQSDDDGGPGFLDAGLDFTVDGSAQTLILRASTFDRQVGRASLRIFLAAPVIVSTGVTSPRVRQIDVQTSIGTINAVPLNRTIPISIQGSVFRLDLEPGAYRATLNTVDGSDPLLQLFDANGQLLDENDDDPDSSSYNSILAFTISEGRRSFIRASTYGSATSLAEMRMDRTENSAAEPVPDGADREAPTDEAPPDGVMEEPVPSGSDDSPPDP